MNNKILILGLILVLMSGCINNNDKTTSPESVITPSILQPTTTIVISTPETTILIPEKSKQEYIDNIVIRGSSLVEINTTKRLLFTKDINMIKYIKEIIIYDNAVNSLKCNIDNTNNLMFIGCVENSTIHISQASFISEFQRSGNYIYVTQEDFGSLLDFLIIEVAKNNNYYVGEQNINYDYPSEKYCIWTGRNQDYFMCNFKILVNNISFRALENLKRSADGESIYKLEKDIFKYLNEEEQKYVIMNRNIFYENINKTEEQRRFSK